nr:GNAT family N-acetyltransferase [Bacteriovorax sp. HI3]
MEIQTTNLILRPFQLSDADELHVFCSDLSNVEHMDWGPNTLEETQKFLLEATALQKDKNPKVFNFAITLKSSGCVIGSCSIWIRSEVHRHGGFGYILNKQFWRKGYGAELAEALLEFGFSTLKFHRISATCFPGNLGSKRLLEKVGLKQEGYLREELYVRGQWRDSLLFSILENEYFDSHRQNIISP